MVNGTHPQSYPNAVQLVIEELEGEVQDIIGGVETRLTSLRRDGLRAFTGEAEAAEAPEVTIPVADPQETEAGAAPVEPVLIGRGKAEVEAALGTVESQEQTEVPPPVKPDSAKSTEEIVSEVVQEAEAEADPLKVVHSEL
jgi:type IV pilus biogenesis protein CpaD/CtpE